MPKLLCDSADSGFMGKIRNPLFIVTLVGASACLDPPAPVEQRSGVYVRDRNAATAPIVIVAKEEAGAATATIAADANRSQLVKASANSQIAGTSVEFPPGSLTQDTQITMQAGPSLAGTVAIVAGAAAGGDGAAPVEIAASATALTIESSAKVDAAAPFTLTLSLPDATAGAGLRGFDLKNPYERLIVVYEVRKYSEGGGKFVGLIPRDRIDLVDGYAAIATQWFGTYQAIITTTKIDVPAPIDIPAPIETPAAVAAEPEPPAAEPLAPVEDAEVKAPEEPQVAEDPAPEPEPAPRRRIVFQQGFLTTSFGNDRPREDGFSGLWHVWGPARVGSSQILSTGLFTATVEGE